MGKLYRIYGWRNIHTDEWYVGKTSRFIEDRAGKNLIQYRHNCPKFSKAIKEYGPESFEQNILRLCTTREDAICWEQYWIKKLDSIEHGYNVNLGTIVTTPHIHIWTEEERQKAREYSLANDPRDNEIWKKKMEEKVFPAMKPVKMIDKETGEVIRTFESQNDAARYIQSLGNDVKKEGIVAGIKSCISGRFKSSYGFGWER